MHLNRRLLLLASLVPQGDIVYDIGCDHALLDIFLTLHNQNTCYAIDEKESALKMARKNIEKYHMEDKIKVLCQNGFGTLKIEEGIAILAGMGTKTILDILKRKEETPLKKIIVQTNNDYALLRKDMMNHGYKITYESVLFDNSIWYVIIVFERGRSKYTRYELQFGPLLKKEKSRDRDLYYVSLIEKRKEILKKLPRGYLGKKIKLKKEILWLKKNLSLRGRK